MCQQMHVLLYSDHPEIVTIGSRRDASSTLVYRVPHSRESRDMGSTARGSQNRKFKMHSARYCTANLSAAHPAHQNRLIAHCC